jgi:hypothetical protein
MKIISIIPRILFVFLVLCTSCKKEKEEGSKNTVPTTTTSTTGIIESNNNLKFGTQDINQFAVEKKSKDDHFLLSAIHITGDPQCSIFLYDSSIPSQTKEYAIANQSNTTGLVKDQCVIAVVYNGTLFYGTGGKLKVDLSGEQVEFSFTNVSFVQNGNANTVTGSGTFYVDK